MPEKYCLPIIKSSKQDVLDTIAQNSAYYAYFEIWLDYIEAVDRDFVSGLANAYPDKLLLLFRRQLLEPIHMPLDARLDLLRGLSGSPVYVDLDVPTQQAELTIVAKEQLKLQLIASYHNYQDTPPAPELTRIADIIGTYHPTILKIATFCRHESDAIHLLELQQKLKARGQKHIIAGMGPHGDATRIFGTLWGNFLVFAPRDLSEQSAPGQFTRERLESIFRILAS